MKGINVYKSAFREHFTIDVPIISILLFLLHMYSFILLCREEDNETLKSSHIMKWEERKMERRRLSK